MRLVSEAGNEHQALFAVLRFDERGLIPVLLEDFRSRKSLACEMMTREALQKTLETRLVHVPHPQTGELVLRGGYNRRARVEGILIECEGRCLVFRVFQHIGACHKGYASCFHRGYDFNHRQVVTLEDVVFKGD